MRVLEREEAQKDERSGDRSKRQKAESLENDA